MLPEPGHFLPTVRLARALRLHGHFVTYLIPAHFAPFFRRLGFPTRSLKIGAYPSAEHADIFDPAFINQEIGRSLDEYLRRTSIGLDQYIAAELESSPCDLMLCDAYFRRFALSISSSVCREILFVNTSLPEHERIYKPHQHPELVLCPAALEIPREQSQAEVRLYGEPSIYRERPMQLFPWQSLSDRPKPLIYCSFGSQAPGYPNIGRAYACILDTAAHLPEFQFVIVASGPHLKSVADWPPNAIVVKSAPQLSLLDRADLFITHGGLGSVKEAILARVPMIVLPFSVDQPRNAECVLYHNIGRVSSPGTVCWQELSAMVSEVMVNAALRESLEKMGDLFQQAEERATIAELVNALAVS